MIRSSSEAALLPVLPEQQHSSSDKLQSRASVFALAIYQNSENAVSPEADRASSFLELAGLFQYGDESNSLPLVTERSLISSHLALDNTQTGPKSGSPKDDDQEAVATGALSHSIHTLIAINSPILFGTPVAKSPGEFTVSGQLASEPVGNSMSSSSFLSLAKPLQPEETRSGKFPKPDELHIRLTKLSHPTAQSDTASSETTPSKGELALSVTKESPSNMPSMFNAPISKAGNPKDNPAEALIQQRSGERESASHSASPKEFPGAMALSNGAVKIGRESAQKDASLSGVPPVTVKEQPESHLLAGATAQTHPLQASGVIRSPANPGQPQPPSTNAGSLNESPVGNPKASPAATEVTVRLQGQQGETVSVRVVDRDGDVHIAVRSTDPQTASALHRDLSTLSSHLESVGWRAELDPSGQSGNRSDFSRNQHDQNNSRKEQNSDSLAWNDSLANNEEEENPWLKIIDQQIFS